jgi:hypothetical protein
MNLKEWFEMDMDFKYFELKFIVIITLISTLFLVNIWPRFRDDVIEFSWLGYLIIIAIVSIIWIIWRKRCNKREI